MRKYLLIITTIISLIGCANRSTNKPTVSSGKIERVTNFPGDDHSERAWGKRLHIPMTFLLQNNEKKEAPIPPYYQLRTK